MSTNKACSIFNRLFPKSFDRESIGTVTRLITVLDRVKEPGWYSTSQTFGKMAYNHRNHLIRVMTKNEYLNVKRDPKDKRYKLYQIAAKGKYLLYLLSRVTV